MDFDYYVIYKPFGMLSQFSKEMDHHITLKDLDYNFKKDVYPVGRLDADSEGLLLLTNDTSLNKKILDPVKKQAKTYWVQVEGVPKEQDLKPIREGLTISIKSKKYQTKAAKVNFLATEPTLPDRNPPIRFRKNVPDSWLSISLIEGKNRQVRKMFAAINFPVLRLVRVKIAGLCFGEGPLSNMVPGSVVSLHRENIST